MDLNLTTWSRCGIVIYMSRAIEFDKDEILDKAMNVFWNKGYESTSMKDLMDATGLLKGSIYNTFDSKENLFILCLEKYGRQSKSMHYKEGDPGEYLRSFFQRLVDQGVNKDFKKGCLIMNSCMEFAHDKSVLSKKAKTLFAATEKNFKNVLEILIFDLKRKKELETIQVALVTAAFSIREISKFKKDKVFLSEIANKALKEVNLSI
jgi:TetR/AcrR family transcriptional repressor of nem operon